MTEQSSAEMHKNLLLEALLTTDSIDNIVRSRRRNELPGQDIIESLEIEGTDVKMHRFLGSGGSKEVYDVELNGVHYALGICGIQDVPERIKQKWKNVLKEPKNTEYIRGRGFFVNEVCEIKPVKVNGIEFPGLFMKRFQDHSFRIFDSKNTSRNDNPVVNREMQIDDVKMLEIMSQIIDEIVKLIKAGIHLGRDSFNICVVNGEVHLYFNDLGSMSVSQISDDDFLSCTKYYTMYAIMAFVSSVDEDTYRNNPYIHKMGDLDNTLQLKIEEAIMQKLILEK